jgi:hypothetical protein
MTFYNVHIYREMRLTYESVEADTAHAAAAIALDMSVGAADDIDDCDGETFAALVDVAGDEHHEQSVTIDFEPERLRKAAPDLLEALERLLHDVQRQGLWCISPDGTPMPPNLVPDRWGQGATSILEARAAVAKAQTFNR